MYAEDTKSMVCKVYFANVLKTTETLLLHNLKINLIILHIFSY